MEEMSSNNGKKNSPSGTSLFEHEHSSWCQRSAAPVAPQQTKSISHSVVFANWPFQKNQLMLFFILFFLLISSRCEVSRRLIAWCWLGWGRRGRKKMCERPLTAAGSYHATNPRYGSLSPGTRADLKCACELTGRDSQPAHLPSVHLSGWLWCMHAVSACLCTCDYCILMPLRGNQHLWLSPEGGHTVVHKNTQSRENTDSLAPRHAFKSASGEAAANLCSLFSHTHTHRHAQTHTWGWALISYSLSTVSWRKQSAAY